MPVHWATFNLALLDWFEPAEQIVEEASKEKIRYIIPMAGQTITLPESLTKSFWWREFMLENSK